MSTRKCERLAWEKFTAAISTAAVLSKLNSVQALWKKKKKIAQERKKYKSKEEPENADNSVIVRELLFFPSR